jgi:restriction system protein
MRTSGVGLTIIEAVQKVMLECKRPMTVREIYDAIVAAGLYVFKTDQPLSVVAGQIRRYCEGMDFPSAKSNKLFVIDNDGKYYIRSKNQLTGEVSFNGDTVKVPTALEELERVYANYLAEFRAKALQQIRAISPIAFECFCRNLLSAFGFRDVVVTRVARDGGIDGHGRLKVGFTYFNVAFQCKSWMGTIGRPEIDRFRGAIQGKYEQGVFFTTSSYSPEAQKSSLRPGAVPVILIDGNTIVDIMIQQRFGVELNSLPVYTLALDLALSD